MAKRKSKKKNNNNNSGSRNKCYVLRGTGQLSGQLTATSAAGSFVSTRYEVDTTLVTTWAQAGKLFARWRIRSLKFHFKSLKGTTTEGNMGICFLRDTNATTPTLTSDALSLEEATFGHVYQNLTLKVKPQHEDWLFTRDAALLDDRLEMPGDVVYWSDNTTASYIPGVATVDYVIEFDGVGNSSVYPMKDDPSTSATDKVEVPPAPEKPLSNDAIALKKAKDRKVREANELARMAAPDFKFTEEEVMDIKDLFAKFSIRRQANIETPEIGRAL